MSKKAIGFLLFVLYLFWCWIVYKHAGEYMFTTWTIYDWLFIFFAPLVLLGLIWKLSKMSSEED